MFVLDYLFTFPEWGPFILRLTLGAAFISHGYPKLFTDPSSVSGWFDSIGIRPGRFWALVVGAAEFFGGIALVFGLFTQLAALLLAVTMFVALVKVKWGKSSYVDRKGGMGWELDLAYLAMALALLFLGPGVYSLADFLGRGY